jgi:hypothetical protein
VNVSTVMAVMPVVPVMVMAVSTPVMVPMTAVPVVMTMVAMMPASMMAVIPSAVAHLDEAGVRQPSQSNCRTEVGSCSRFRRTHEQAEAESQPNCQSPKHILLLGHRALRLSDSEHLDRISVSSAL